MSYDELAKLGELRDSGVLTDTEFAAEKTKTAWLTHAEHAESGTEQAEDRSAELGKVVRLSSSLGVLIPILWGQRDEDRIQVQRKRE
jgi:hypothetical protein